MAKLFVYGTLMSGSKSNHILAVQHYIGVGVLEGYALYNVSEAYPGIVKQADKHVIGDVYEVDANTIRKLDYHEGTNLGIYSRDIVEVIVNEKKEIAHTYVWLKGIDGIDEVSIENQPWAFIKTVL